MRVSSKKSILLPAYDCSRLVTKHATRAQAAEKVLDACNHKPTNNPELTNISDQHRLISDDTGKMLLLTAEGNNIHLFINFFP